MANILIADDDPDFLQVFQRGLTAMGHHVHCVSGGKSVHRLIEANPGQFDIVFLDFVMPGGGGVSTLHKLRSVDGNIPVVFITGHVDALDSPLFTMGLGMTQARVSKTTPLADLDRLVRRLTVTGP
ncbi:response regulator [Tropicibacter sp. S64]|uniref:response regulator n=1 Tax=Tropicibacter sp. S64 TaxID=3415122 RepID=UPI003C7E5141